MNSKNWLQRLLEQTRILYFKKIISISKDNRLVWGSGSGGSDFPCSFLNLWGETRSSQFLKPHTQPPSVQIFQSWNYVSHPSFWCDGVQGVCCDPLVVVVALAFLLIRNSVGGTQGESGSASEKWPYFPLMNVGVYVINMLQDMWFNSND